MRQVITKIAVVLISVALNVYLLKANLDWLPDWVPLAVMGAAGVCWLATEPQVRALFAVSFKTELGRIIHPTTHQPVRLPKLQKKKAVITVVVVLAVALLIGGAAWRFRSEAFAVVGTTEFEFTGAYHPPFGGPEEYMATIGVDINNRTRYSTGLTDWNASLHFKDGKTAYGEMPVPTDKDMPLGLGAIDGQRVTPYTLKAVDYLPIKSEQPIPPGGGTWGWVQFIFKGYTRDDIRGKGVSLILEYSEIATSKKHVITYFIDAPVGDLPPGTFRIRKHPEASLQEN